MKASVKLGKKGLKVNITTAKKFYSFYWLLNEAYDRAKEMGMSRIAFIHGARYM